MALAATIVSLTGATGRGGHGAAVAPCPTTGVDTTGWTVASVPGAHMTFRLPSDFEALAPLYAHSFGPDSHDATGVAGQTWHRTGSMDLITVVRQTPLVERLTTSHAVQDIQRCTMPRGSSTVTVATWRAVGSVYRDGARTDGFALATDVAAPDASWVFKVTFEDPSRRDVALAIARTIDIAR